MKSKIEKSELKSKKWIKIVKISAMEEVEGKMKRRLELSFQHRFLCWIFWKNMHIGHTKKFQIKMKLKTMKIVMKMNKRMKMKTKAKMKKKKIEIKIKIKMQIKKIWKLKLKLKCK